MNGLKCDMNSVCQSEVKHVDSKGWVYCDFHADQRRQDVRVRKLKKSEVAAR